MRTYFQNTDNRNILLIVLLALITRLIVLPWSQTVHADAVSRVFIAADWLKNPHYITEGYWGPLHHYLNALFMTLFPGNIVGPKMLNILLASLTVIPLYRFTMNIFNSRRGAVFVVLLYVLCPLIFRNSFQALSGISYAFFIVLAMYLISEGIKREGKLIYAVFAGLAITCAAATRYEAWVVIATFTLVTLLFKEWKFTFVFWLFAMLFPGTWMIGNQLEFGDFLYSVNQNDVWNIQLEGINDNITSIERIKRVVFFPLSFALNVSPITTLLLLFAVIGAAIKMRFTKKQLIWLVPFAIMFVLFLQKGWAGTLMLQNRFTITWIILLLPFVALVFQNEKYTKLKTSLLVLALVTTIPLSFFWEKVPYTKILGENNLGWALDDIALNTFREFEAVPLLKDKDTEKIVEVINVNSELGDGLVLDFIGWDRTYYTALRAMNRCFITSGSKHGENDYELLTKYIANHRSGLILLSRIGKLNTDATFRGSLLELKDVSYPLIVNEVIEINGVKLFSYEVTSNQYADSVKKQIIEPTPIFPTERDINFFKLSIKNDTYWYRSIQRSAFWKGNSLDEELTENAKYMVEIENESVKKNP